MRKQLRPGTYDPTGYDNTFYVRDAQGNIMSTYDLEITEATNDYDAALILSEQPIYGSDRIGVRNPNLTVYSNKVDPANLWTRPDEAAYTTTDSILLFPLQNAPSTGSGTVIHSGNPIVQYITAQIAHAAEGVFDMRYNQNSLTIPYNSRIGLSTQNTAVALNDCGNIELYATVNHDVFQMINDPVYDKLKLFGRNRNLINPGTVINADDKSQSAFTRVPGTENRWYYITLSEGKVWLHTIDATVGTVESANLNLDPSNSNYGRTLALVEDNTGAGTGMLYVRRYNNTTKKTELVGFAINESGVGAPSVLAEFSSKDVSGDGEIQLSPDASRLAVANKTGKSFLWFNLVTGSDVRLFDVNATHNVLSNATTVLSANYVYYQSLDFTESGDYLYVMKQTGNSTTPVRYNIITPGSVNLSSVTGGGDIRRGTDGNMYVATNKKMYYISSPETATSANAMSSWNNAYNMTQSLSAQPVRMGIYSIPCGGTYARVMNQKQYELKDHLGNVRVTFSDLKQPQDCDLLADGYVATAMSVNNYYSFGMLQPGRNWSTENYRYSYNGKEQDNEIKGAGNSLDFGARMYDPRLARFLSLDPRMREYPFFSPYLFAANNPVKFIDVDGEGPEDPTKRLVLVSTNNKEASVTNTFINAGINLRTEYNGNTFYGTAKASMIYVNSGRDIVNSINAQSPNSIKSLDIYSHGGPDGLWFKANSDGSKTNFYISSDKMQGDQGQSSSSSSVEAVNFNNFTIDARIEFQGCATAGYPSFEDGITPIGADDNLAQEMSTELFNAGKTKGVVIGHYGQSGPDENNDYRQNTRVVYHNGTELFRTNKKGNISDFRIQNAIRKKERALYKSQPVGVGTEGTSHPNP